MNENYTKNIIALCYILDEFEEFNKKIKGIISTNNSKKFIFDLYEVSMGNFNCSMKARRFYNENKAVIDTINQYSNLFLFIDSSYNREGNSIDENSLEFFYRYITEHRQDLGKILSVLNKINNIKVGSIKLDEGVDFTKEEYRLYTWYPDNLELSLLDNMDVIPSYDSFEVKYRTTGSNYKITMNSRFGKLDSYINTQITLNSLTFDPKEIPNYVSAKEVFRKIFELRDQKSEEYSTIKNLVDLNMSIEELYSVYVSVSKKIENLDESENKENFIELLKVIKDAIIRMQAINEQMDSDVVSSSLVSKETLDKEKQICKKGKRH